MSISASPPLTGLEPDRVGTVLRWALFVLAIVLAIALVWGTSRPNATRRRSLRHLSVPPARC